MIRLAKFDMLKIGLLSSRNLDLLPRYMEPVLSEYGLKAEFYVSPFAQYRQDILHNSSPLKVFSPNCILLFLDGADLFGDLVRRPLDFDVDMRQKRVEEELNELRSLVERIQDCMPAADTFLNSIIVPPLNAAGMLEYNSPYSLRDAFSHYNEGLRGIAQSRRRCYIVDYERLVSWHGYREWYDDRTWYIGRMGLSRSAMQELARKYVVTFRATLDAGKKCLVVDLDDTLWGGVVGSEGTGGIQLGTESIGLAYREFQEEILNLHKQGVILAINSKNNWDDAVEVIDQHPSMVLRREHFAVMKINWNDKVTNMREIAQELNLGLDSLVFIDNSPFEREWLKDQLPQVEVVALPQDPAMFRRCLLNLDSFAKLVLTEEDRERGQLYRQHAMVENLRRAASDLESFYAGLQMKAAISRTNPRTITRIAQLTQKTNQFNLTTRRYTEGSIEKMVRSRAYRVYSLSLTDRFGDNGLVGVAIIAEETEAWRIDTFLLSCRVMGRTVETAFLAFLASCAREHGMRYLVGEYLPTKKNMPVSNFYPSHGFKRTDDRESLWQLDLSHMELHAPPYIELFVNDQEKLSFDQSTIG